MQTTTRRVSKHLFRNQLADGRRRVGIDLGLGEASGTTVHHLSTRVENAVVTEMITIAIPQ
eukprot:5087453-Amphidinium_carterae.1